MNDLPPFPSTALSRDGRTLASTRQDGAVSVVDTRRLTSRRLPIVGGPSPDSPAAPIDAPSAPAFGPDGTLVVAGFGGFLGLVDAQTGAKGHHDLVLAPSASADGRIVVAAGWDGRARLWDTRTRRPLGASIAFSAPDGAAAISPDGSSVAISEVARSLDVRDVHSRRRLAHLRIDDSAIGFAAFSRDGSLLLAGSGDGHVRAFSTRNWQPTGPAFLAHAGWIASVDASPDGRTLVTAGQDGQVRLWDLATRRPIGAPLSGRTNDANVVARFTPDGKYVLAVFADGSGYRWDVRPSAWKRQACAVAGRRLTRSEWRAALPDRVYAPAC